MKRHCLTLDLKNDPELIQQYEQMHKEVWPEIINSIKNSGIKNMQIYRYEARLFMIMEVDNGFSFVKKQQLDNSNERVKEWEKLMSKFQQRLQGGVQDEKWKLMNKIFELKEY